MPGCRLGCRALRIDRNCIEKRVRDVCERTAWRVFYFDLVEWWLPGDDFVGGNQAARADYAMILLAEIRLHERIIWIG